MSKRIIGFVLAVALGFAPTAVDAEHKLLCPQWARLAQRVGFTQAQYRQLDYIIWRESRCAPKAVNTNFHGDGRVTKDWGLTQVNDFSWITFLRNRKIVTKSSELLSPVKNLRAAKALFDYSQDRHGDPWLQWRKR